MRTRFIDADSHVLEPDDLWENYLEAPFRSEMPRTKTGYRIIDGQLAFFNDVSIGDCNMPIGTYGVNIVMPNLGEAYDEYARQGFPARSFVDAMNRSDIASMVLYPSAGLYTNQAPNLSAATGAAYRRAYNNWLADFCSGGEGRLIGAGGLDLRDTQSAAKEAIRCVRDLKFKAVFINPSPVGPHPLYHESNDRLWATIADLDVPLGIHPGAMNACDPMLYQYLPGIQRAQAITAFSIGNMIACAGFVCGGVLERHPKLRVAFLESGAGWVAFWLDRMKVGIQGGMRELPIEGLTLDPTEYFQRQCFISADPDDSGIKQVIDVLGDDNIVVATDFGHPEGRHYSRAAHEVSKLVAVSSESKEKILWDNPTRLYNLG